MGSIRDQVVRRPETGSPSGYMGPHTDPRPTNDVACEYLATPLTRACGPASSLRSACLSDRVPSRRRWWGYRLTVVMTAAIHDIVVHSKADSVAPAVIVGRCCGVRRAPAG